MNILNSNLHKNHLRILEIGTIILFCFLPLFFSFPYKINIYLTWEGAYRISEGQIPFKDFGLPLGYIFWLIPSLFFKIFGPYMLSLIKAQVFINLISLLTLRAIMKLFGINPVIQFLSLLLFSLSYVFINFWPWYNHTVFVLELIGIYFITRAVLEKSSKKKTAFLVVSALFIFLSFFTKQDIGGLAIMLSLALIIYHSLVNKTIVPFLTFFGALVIIGTVFILPLMQYDFTYWFNYGQAPHYSRINFIDYLNDVFSDSSILLRLYLIVVLLIGLVKKDIISYYLTNEKDGLFFLLTLGIIVQVILAQVTSYIPANAHYYYHSFVFLFVAQSLLKDYKLTQVKTLLLGIVLIFFWQSSDYWKYGKRIIGKVVDVSDTPDYSKVSKRTWNLRKANNEKGSEWVKSNYKSLSGIYIPKPTLEGIDRLKQNSVFSKPDISVLNMTELTFLAYELEFELQTSPQQPLWYHRNVALFDREVDYICGEITSGAYDIVLFEDIPDLNEFYPSAIRECLEEYYKLSDQFLAPRKPENSTILVFEK